MTSRRSARALLVCGVLLAALPTLVACGKDKSGGTSGSSQIGGAPTTPPGTPAATTTPPTATPTTAPPPAGVTFPADAKGYTLEVLKAWGNKDYARVELFAQSYTVAQIKDSVATGGVPNTQWTYIRCSAGEAAGTTDCVWRNANGDEAVIRVTDSQVGHPVAAVQANLDRTDYSSSPEQYVTEFLGAWRDGNEQRMARLASTSIKNYFKGQGNPMQNGTATSITLDSTYTKVTVDGSGVELGRSYVFKVLTAPGGKANAIKAACTSGCA